MANRVRLVVYDLSMGMARQMSMALLGQQIDGIWHTGIEVYGLEYFYGGGIQSLPHSAFAASFGIQPTRTIDLGHTDVDRATFEDFLREINHRFTPVTYDLITNNCNNFTDACAHFLLGQGIPEEIVGLPQRVFSTPLGQMLRPMFEQVQNSARGGGGMTMDPFAAVGGAVLGGVPVHQSGLDSPRSMHNTPHRETHTRHVLSPDEARRILSQVLRDHGKPLLSADCSTVSAILNKIYKFFDDATTGGLSAEEREQLAALGSALSQGRAFPAAFEMLSRVAARSDKARVHVYFLLRLVVLNPANWSVDESQLACVNDTISSIGQRTLTLTAHTMALCVCANLFATPQGIAYATEPGRIDAIVDAAMRALGHERSEVRTMASTVLSNYSQHLFNVQSSAGATPAEELPPLVVQIICGILQDLTSEADETVKFRRLLCTARLVVGYDEGVMSLIRDLDFVDTIARSCDEARGGTELHTLSQALESVLGA